MIIIEEPVSASGGYESAELFLMCQLFDEFSSSS